jgi:ComF family protein
MVSGILLLSTLRSAKSKLMNIKWPSLGFSSHCVLCGAAGASDLALCGGCEAEIQPQEIGNNACERCALPLHGASEGTVCGECLKEPPPYFSTYRFAIYQPPLDRLIQLLKFHDKLYVARMLGRLMARDIRRRGIDLPELLMPVPLHAGRLQQRGYNQALEVARFISREFWLPLDRTSCIRHKATPEQAALPAKERGANIKGAFDVTGNVRDKHIAIVDDVMTTGSTVTELAKALLRAGAGRVDVWVCARAVL